MLVLSRKRNEEVVIGQDIHITVLAVRGNKVSLGFTAPNDVAIRRAELECRTGRRPLRHAAVVSHADDRNVVDGRSADQ